MNKSVCVALILMLIACQHGRRGPADADYALWSAANGDGNWTQAAERSVRRTALARQTPNDISQFCPEYVRLDRDTRIMFWVALLSAMAKYESNFDPGLAYTEKFTDGAGEQVVSRGLLQLSIESASQPRYDCEIARAVQLHDPAANISCGVNILSTWVRSDGVIAFKDGEPRGGARYWSVLRASNPARAEISSLTRGLEFCEAPVMRGART